MGYNYGSEPSREQFAHDGGVAVAEVPQVFERAFGVAAFAPSAAFVRDEVSPTEFRPGDNIDIDVEYKASNPEAWWNTCIAVTRQDTGAVYQKRHSMIEKSDDYIVEPIVCGKMPDEAIELVVEIWGHPDYWTGTTPY